MTVRSSVVFINYWNGVPNIATIRAYIKGMDIAQSACDIIAMLAPVSGLCP